MLGLSKRLGKEMYLSTTGPSLFLQYSHVPIENQLNQKKKSNGRISFLRGCQKTSSQFMFNFHTVSSHINVPMLRLGLYDSFSVRNMDNITARALINLY